MKNKLIIILLAIIMVGTLAALFWFKPQNSALSPAEAPIVNEEDLVLPTERSASPELQKKLNSLDRIVLKNEAKLEKSLVTTDSCNNTVGLTSYRPPNYDILRFMNINNKNLDQTEDAKKGLEDLQKFLDKNLKVIDFERPIDQAFREACTGAYGLYLKDLSGINYPNTDQYRITITQGGQDGFGVIEIRVYARKGDNYIRLLSSIQDSKLYEQAHKECKTDSDDPEVIKCYTEKLKTDKNLEQVAIKEAQELIRLFELSS